MTITFCVVGIPELSTRLPECSGMPVIRPERFVDKQSSDYSALRY
jgi:hypothetical protein